MSDERQNENSKLEECQNADYTSEKSPSTNLTPEERPEISIDLCTPYNVKLTCFFKRSFAYYSTTRRMPAILSQITNVFVKSVEEVVKEHGKESREEVGKVIEEIARYRNEIQTNKPIVDLVGHDPTTAIWNDYLRELSVRDCTPTHLSTVWLFTDCYMYGRLNDILLSTKTLRDYDLFKKQKRKAFTTAVDIMTILSKYQLRLLFNTQSSERQTKRDFVKLLKFNLWSNRCDLSLSLGADIILQVIDPLLLIQTLEENILIDQTDKIWTAVSSNKSGIVDFVNDNSGYELFTDFCIADFILARNLASQIRFFVKKIPWFISDVTCNDFYWTIESLCRHDNVNMAEIGNRWKNHLFDGRWIVEIDRFWTLPFDYSVMKTKDSALYKKLSEAKLIIFKGDLNYRKLIGDINWDPTTSFKTALQGFHPSRICVLRTVKSDNICGLRKGLAEKLDKIDKNWMTTGEYGVIQCCAKVKR